MHFQRLALLLKVLPESKFVHPIPPVHVGRHIDNLPLRLVLSFLKVRFHAYNTTNICVQVSLSIFCTYSTGTEFGMMLPGTSSRIHAVCVLTSRTQMQGRLVAQGNVVVEVLRVLNAALHPMFPGAFDEEEPVCVGGFYEWPCSQLKFMKNE